MNRDDRVIALVKKRFQGPVFVTIDPEKDAIIVFRNDGGEKGECLGQLRYSQYLDEVVSNESEE